MCLIPSLDQLWCHSIYFLHNSHMLPLFTESPNSPEMVWHAMKMIRDATVYINPGQTPVMEVD